MRVPVVIGKRYGTMRVPRTMRVSGYSGQPVMTRRVLALGRLQGL